MRTVQDYYFKKAKKESYPARSVYKLEEAQKKYGLLHPGDTVLDLGCLPGSWSQYAAKVCGPAGLVVGVDVQTGMDALPRGAQTAAIEVVCADVMDVGMIAQVTAICPSFRVVLSDMAPQTSGNKWVDHQRSIALSRRALEVAAELLGVGGGFYCKVFQGEDFPLFFAEVRKRFKTAKSVKPKSSRTESREVFVAGMGFLKEV